MYPSAAYFPSELGVSELAAAAFVRVQQQLQLLKQAARLLRTILFNLLSDASHELPAQKLRGETV